MAEPITPTVLRREAQRIRKDAEIKARALELAADQLESRADVVPAQVSRPLNMKEISAELERRGFRASPALLSMARQGKRTIKFSVAKEIEEIAGIPATGESWPKIVNS